jgi:hypothetical protein
MEQECVYVAARHEAGRNYVIRLLNASEEAKNAVKSDSRCPFKQSPSSSFLNAKDYVAHRRRFLFVESYE